MTQLRMMPMPGTRVDALPFVPFTHVRNVVEYDGPLIVDLIGSNGTEWVAIWTDGDHLANRWLVFAMPHAKTALLPEADLSKAEEMEAAKTVYFMDLDAEFRVVSGSTMNALDVPREYRP